MLCASTGTLPVYDTDSFHRVLKELGMRRAKTYLFNSELIESSVKMTSASSICN